MRFNNLRWRHATFQNDAGGEGGSGGGGAGDSGDGDWRSALPEGVRDWDEFKNAETPEAAFERLGHMRSKFGTGLFAPGEDATAEDWNAFYGKLSERTNGKVIPRPDGDDAEALNALYTSLGRPEDASGYQFSEGTDADTAAAISKLALDNNLTVAQMKGMDEGMAQLVTEQQAAAAAERQAGLDTLKGEWGAAWNERSTVAEKVREKFLNFIPADAMNKATMEALYAIGKSLGGEGAQLLNQENKDPEPTVAEAEERIAELTKAMDEARKNGDRDELRRLTEKRRLFYKKKNAGGGSVTLGGRNGQTLGRGGVSFG